MTLRTVVPALASLMVLSSCASSDNQPRWEPTAGTQSVAESECGEQVDIKMQ
jgi:hypothetical protein